MTATAKVAVVMLTVLFVSTAVAAYTLSGRRPRLPQLPA